MPQKCAGNRIELDRSVPISNGVIPEASAAAAPPTGTARSAFYIPRVIGPAEDRVIGLKIAQDCD
jgi:hypothetical protein